MHECLIFTGNTVLSAIYIEPPADVRSVPQNYTIHCITTGQSTSSITVGLFLEKHEKSYYYDQLQPQNISSLSGYSTVSNTSLTYDFSEVIAWGTNIVEMEEPKIKDDQEIKEKYDGDHHWVCHVNSNETLETSIRGKNNFFNHFIIKNLFIQLLTSLPLT